ncbi:hypothetical protein [Streptomyces wuyuanensis]|uniref:Gram-positive cocci surface proteins LPxTG domain-containing protein n=1 Tax=Streptomyces wuyuanensis TaxID=1196353 RepID=A0A1G9ZHV0_9ACTN|nr:hypothetical protein [Streptomyces wuyuanensis]SDN20136.1 hypothetical protein SAMN05444921_121144 [Streptomyces wuyuanensis]
MHRTVRAVLAAALAGPAFALTAAANAQAHGDTLKVEITGHDFGRVRTTVVWENDNDPVDGRIAATVNATAADGRTAGPWKLVRDPATRTGWNTAEALPPGSWKVTVEAGYPGLGRDEEEITVSPGTPASPAAPPAGTGSEVPATPGTARPTTAGADPAPPTPGAVDPATSATSATNRTPSTAAAGAEPAAPGLSAAPLVVGGLLLAGAAGTVVALRARRVR